MSKNIFSIHKILILLIFNLSFINNSPRPSVEEAKPEHAEMPKEEENNLFREF